MCTLSTKIFCQIVYEKKNIQLWGLWCRRLSFRRTKQYCVLSRFQNTTKSLASHREHPTTCKYIVLLLHIGFFRRSFELKAHTYYLQWAKQAGKCANLFWIKTFGLLLWVHYPKKEIIFLSSFSFFCLSVKQTQNIIANAWN